jgi:pimeloyl-ACP methyl ester carboxylesterase
MLEAGDVAGATELNLATWLGPDADAATREKVREMQRHNFEVQLVASDETGPVRVPHELSAITAPSLVVSGAHDLPDFRVIAAELAARLPGARLVELGWAGHLPSLERPDAVNDILIEFLGEVLPAR